MEKKILMSVKKNSFLSLSFSLIFEMHIIITSLCELCHEEWNCSLLSLWGCSDCSFSWELGNLQRSREHRAVLELAVYVCESSKRC